MCFPLRTTFLKVVCLQPCSSGVPRYCVRWPWMFVPSGSALCGLSGSPALRDDWVKGTELEQDAFLQWKCSHKGPTCCSAVASWGGAFMSSLQELLSAGRRVPGGSSQAVPGPKERCGAWSGQCSPRPWEEFQPLCKPMDLPFMGTWVTVNEIISIRWLACHRHAIPLCSLLHTLEFAESSACPCCADPSRSCVQCQMAGFVLSGQQESSWFCCYYLLFQVVWRLPQRIYPFNF